MHFSWWEHHLRLHCWMEFKLAQDFSTELALELKWRTFTSVELLRILPPLFLLMEECWLCTIDSRMVQLLQLRKYCKVEIKLEQQLLLRRVRSIWIKGIVLWYSEISSGIYHQLPIQRMCWPTVPLILQENQRTLGRSMNLSRWKDWLHITNLHQIQQRLQISTPAQCTCCSFKINLQPPIKQGLASECVFWICKDIINLLLSELASE